MIKKGKKIISRYTKILCVILLLLMLFVGIVVFRLYDKDGPIVLPLGQQILKSFQGKNSSAQSLDHIVIIMMENKPYNDIVGSQNAPFINSLIHKYSSVDHYSAVAHPSLPNYIALIGGSTFGIMSDCSDCFIASPNLVDQLEVSDKTWMAYMESMPNPCYVGSKDTYVQKHDPFIYFDDIRNNPNRCNHIVPYSQFHSDIKSVKTTANFIWITPNLCDDMHDCSVSDGDHWLAQNVPIIINSPAFTQQKSVLIITWDEGSIISDNKIPTIFTGKEVKNNFISHQNYTHYSLLHTIENQWGLPILTTNVLKSSVITDVLK